MGLHALLSTVVILNDAPVIGYCLTTNAWNDYVSNAEILLDSNPYDSFGGIYAVSWDNSADFTDLSYCTGGIASDGDLFARGFGAADRSVYSVKVFEFSLNASKQFALSVKDNTTYLKANNVRWNSDFSGDGLTDLSFRFGHANAFTPLQTLPSNVSGLGSYYYHSRGASSTGAMNQPDVLNKVTNGLGVISEWDYAPLSSNANRSSNELPFYTAQAVGTPGRYADDNHFRFTSSMYAVSDFRQSNGVGSLNTTRYSYRDAVYNNKGRGFQGFRTVIVDTPTSLNAQNEVNDWLRSVFTFHQFHPLAGKIETLKTCLASDNDALCDTTPLSTTEVKYTSAYTNVNTNQKVLWVYPHESVETTFDLNQRGTQLSKTTSRITNVDHFGNVWNSETEVDNGFGIHKTAVANLYVRDTANWWVNKLTSSTTTTDSVASRINTANIPAGLDSEKVVEVTTSWTTSRQPDVITTKAITGGGKTVSIDTDYNDKGLPEKVSTLSAGETTRWVETTYDGEAYFVASTKNQKGHDTLSNISPYHGQALSVRDTNHQRVDSTYDAFGRLIQVQTQGRLSSEKEPAAYTGYQSCASGCPTHAVYKAVTRQVGSPRIIQYKDKLNRVIKTETQGFEGTDSNANTIVQWVKYDALGRIIYESIPSYTDTYNNIGASKGTQYQSFDTLGRLTQKTTDQVQNQSLSITYSYSGFDTAINAAGLSLSRTYSGSGQLMSTTDAKNGVTRYAYDGMGNPIVLEDANGNQITATYNALGQKLWVDDPNMGKKTFTYTGFGEVKTELDANGNTTTYTFDELGRLKQRDVSGPNEISTSSFNFDRPIGANQDECQGLPYREAKGTFTKTYHYDTRCRLKETKTTIDGKTYTMSTYWDSHYGRPKGMTYPSGLTLKYDYDTTGIVKTTSNALTNETYRTIDEMDALGNWTEASIGTGNVSISRQFDVTTGQLLLSSLMQNTTRQQQLAYTDFDEFGNLKKQGVENRLGGGQYTSWESYQYDTLHRLTKATRIYHDQQQTVVDYDYDSVGNFKYKTDFSTQSASAYQYGAQGKANPSNAGPNAVKSIALANSIGTRSYFYDNNGNLTFDGLRNISYNGFNKPKVIDLNPGNKLNPYDQSTTGDITLHFDYGPDQMRYKQVKAGGQSVTTIYIGKAYEEIITGTKVEKKSYIGDIAIHTETTDNGQKTNTTHYFHRDRLGSMTAIFDDNGTIIERHSFDAFGKPRDGEYRDHATAIMNSAITTRGFTDHEQLDDAQLIHMNGRAYDYNLGRFLSVDPFIQEPGNSQSMNPYSYIMNNPLAGTDPSGYVSVCNKGVKRSNCGSYRPDSVMNGATGRVARTNGKDLKTSAGISNGAEKAEDILNAPQRGEAGYPGNPYCDPDNCVSHSKGESGGTGEVGLGSKLKETFFPAITNFGENGEEGSLLDDIKGFFKEGWNVSRNTMVYLPGIGPGWLLVPELGVNSKEALGAATFEGAFFIVGGAEVALSKAGGKAAAGIVRLLNKAGTKGTTNIPVIRVGTSSKSVVEVPLSEILPLHPVPRPSMPENHIANIANSIGSNGYDIMHAIPILRLPSGKLVSAGGHHRVAAMKLLNEASIPATIREWSSLSSKAQQRMLDNKVWGATLRGYLNE
ncbi:RHS repeat-associated core domain-containing protein [Pleionea sp. CnH1-48]|uniref:RHS repeat-associated core domain-containing protein n=1 Tax=Pleionea sp. CnH1-48 TaxID=2954494 RepID=UPI0020978D0B|nr:RHS repeat-associated core domain-containing protein [Pleionea sp. CnH1-48]MCO7224811.1 hypothetical protein [Pleionea sp. CnH1-48]